MQTHLERANLHRPVTLEEMHQAIHELARIGLTPRDISSALGVQVPEVDRILRTERGGKSG